MNRIAARVREVPRQVAASRAIVVGVSGIDGCEKSWFAERLATELRRLGLGIAAIGIDGWLNLPAVRFSDIDPGGHFCRNAIRFDELFDELVFPLHDARRWVGETNVATETATAFRRRAWSFVDIDVVLLEGIFLLKRELRPHLDLSLWLECQFETALQRAVSRAQEELPPEETITAYRTIYFPPQRIQFDVDHPVQAASMVVDTDRRAAERRRDEDGAQGGPVRRA